MKKFTLLTIVLCALVMFSFNDYGTCMGTDGYKALTCGACHGGSISNDVFILDGKTEFEEEGSFEYLVRIPVAELASLQLGTRVLTSLDQNPSVNLDIATEQSLIKGQTLFSLVNIKEKSTNAGGKDVLYSRLSFQFDKPLEEATTIAVQGVLANGDGTLNGDQSFYKEIVLEPKKPVSTKLDAYIYNHSLFLNDIQPGLLRIYNLQGSEVYAQQVDGTGSQVDLSTLNPGVYHVLMGSSKRNMKSMKISMK